MSSGPDSITPDLLTSALDELRLRCTPIHTHPDEEPFRGIQFPRGEVSLHVVVQGEWLIDADVHLWRHLLVQGDLVLAKGCVEGALRRCSGADRGASVLSMRVCLDAPHGHPLIEALPPIIRVTSGGVPLSLGLCLEALFDELLRRIVGRPLIIRQLCEVLGVQALRSHLDDIAWNDQGFFRALVDPVLREPAREDERP